MGKLYFSIEEAQTFIQLNKDKIRRLMELAEETEAMKFVKIEPLDDDPEHQTKMLEVNKNYYKALAELFEGLHALNQEGCIVKDIGKGLVDFYSKFGSRDILLCWKHGEPELRHWHTIEAGFNGRQSIDVLKKEYEQKLQKLI